MAYYSGGLEDLDKGNDECVEIAFNLEDWDDSMDYSSLVTSAARKGRLEVRLRKMNDKDKLLFQDAMKNEAGGWLTAEAVRIVARHNVDPSRLLRCRFVLTWKENPEDGTKKAKARLVVLGFADPDLIHLRAEAPVASRRARQILLALAAQRRWRLEKADAVTAFLQGDATEQSRQVFAAPPPEVREAFGMKDDELLQMLKAGFGFVHAPRKWWQKVCAKFKELNLESLKSEPCTWALRDSRGRLVGGVILHVDDMIIAGDWSSKAFLDKRAAIEQAFQWTPGSATTSCSAACASSSWPTTPSSCPRASIA